MNKIKLLLLAAGAALAIAGCDSNIGSDNDDGMAEKAGASLDKAGKQIEDAAKDVGKALEEACEDVKDGVGAKDAKCD